MMIIGHPVLDVYGDSSPCKWGHFPMYMESVFDVSGGTFRCKWGHFPMNMPCIHEQFVEENFRLEKNVCRELPYTWHIHEKVPPLTLQNAPTYTENQPHIHQEGSRIHKNWLYAAISLKIL
jgi:hypothetical protein